MRKAYLIGAGALAIGLGACMRDKNSAADQGPDNVRQAIIASETKWQADMKAHNIEALANQYTDDASVAVGGGVLSGSTAIRKMFAEAATDPAMKVDFASDKIDVATSGDMAYSRGHFSEQYTDPKTHKVMSDSGAYLSVYQKQDGGDWKMVADYSVVDPSSIKEVPPAKPATRAKMTSF